MNSTKGTKNLTIKDGIKDGIPIFLGYFPIAMAFGILSRGTGLTLIETLSFSFILFAGAAQFIAVGMIASGVGVVEMIIAIFFLNFRHFLMSASLSAKTHFRHPILKPFVSFFVTDESFSVASFADGNLSECYLIPMQLLGYFGWGIGTGVGFIIGAILPPLLQKAMGIGLYVMFIALLIPEIKKTNKAIILSLLAGVMNTILRLILHMPQGWSIVLTIITVSFLGIMIYDGNTKKITPEEVTDYE